MEVEKKPFEKTSAGSSGHANEAMDDDQVKENSVERVISLNDSDTTLVEAPGIIILSEGNLEESIQTVRMDVEDINTRIAPENYNKVVMEDVQSKPGSDESVLQPNVSKTLLVNQLDDQIQSDVGSADGNPHTEIVDVNKHSMELESIRDYTLQNEPVCFSNITEEEIHSEVTTTVKEATAVPSIHPSANAGEENKCEERSINAGDVKQEDKLPTSMCTAQGPGNMSKPASTVLPKEEVLSGLSLLAQYTSDEDDESDGQNGDADESDTSSIMEVKNSNSYRNHVVEIDSDINTDTESDSSSESAHSDFDLKSDARDLLDKFTEERNDDESDEDAKSSSGKTQKRQPPKVKGELLLEDLPPIEDLHITVPEEECTLLGKVHSIVNQLILVSALPNAVLVDLETVLFLEKGQQVLGEVFDVLGQVADPLYCVRFNSNEQIQEKGIKIGDSVYVAPKTEYTQHVILSKLIKDHGSDASWENDIEPPPRYLDYSDDEEERKARTHSRNRDHSRDPNDVEKRFRPETPEQGEGLPTHSKRDQRRRGGRDGRMFRPPYMGPRPNCPNNFDPSSWHANYYRPYRPGYPPTAQFAPFHPYFNAAHAYGPPPPIMPHQPPGYLLNPYAMRPPTLQPTITTPLPPPPPPGTQQ